MERKLLLAALCAFSYSAVHGQSDVRKNVLFILTDDMQNNAIGALGNHQVQTPNIDELVNSGTAFVNTYTNGSIGGALSMPSRAMLMTGRGVFQVKRDGSYIPPEEKTIGETFRENGYNTFATGKWHADAKSFNRSFEDGDNLHFGGMHSYHEGGHVTPYLKHYDTTGEYKEDRFIGGKFSSEMFADAAVKFIESSVADPRPFFTYVAFTSPHDPRQQHPWYGNVPSGDTIKLPPNFLSRHPFDNGELEIRDEVLLPIPRTEKMMRDDLANYYGMINEVDVQIGRIIDALKESGQYENTIIVFAADNGLAMGQHGLIGKQNLYDPSAKVPLIFVGGSIPEGAKSGSYAYLFDVFPTLCDLTGMNIPSSVTGHSLVPAAKKGNKGGRNEILLAYSSIQRAIVKDHWKYIIYNVAGVITEQLFDLKNDPWEMHSKAGDPKYASKVKKYHELLQAEMTKAGDFCNLNDPTWWGQDHKITWEEGLNLFQ